MKNIKFKICNFQFALSLFMLVIIFSSILILSCGGQKEDAGQTTLTYWQTYNDDENALFAELAAEYQASHPGVIIQATRLPFMGAEPKILTALATRTTPDIARPYSAENPPGMNITSSATLRESSMPNSPESGSTTLTPSIR